MLIPALAIAQVEEPQNGQIELGTGGKDFFIKDGQGYKLNQYKQAFTNQEAIDHIKRARTNKSIASILTYSGGAILGLGVGVYVITKSTEGNFLGYILSGSTIALGTGIMLSSIPLWMGYSKNIRKGIEVENGATENSVSQLKLNVNGNGVGMAYQF